jgi:hypothetical protein
MIYSQIKLLGDRSAIESIDPLSPPLSKRDNRMSIQVVTNKTMKCFRVVSFIHNIILRFPRAMTLFQEKWCMLDVMDRTPGQLEPSNDLTSRVH